MSLHDKRSFWHHIVNEVEKTEVPLECITKIVLKLTGNRQKTINVANLLKQGLSIDDAENLVQRMMDDYEDQIRKIDFSINVDKVAEIVQPETDKLLKGM